MKVFISYSSCNRSDALDVRRILEEKGCDVWLDAFDINPSENLEEELCNNIKYANVFCLLLSPTSVSSKWVTKEISQALIERKRGLRILPVILHPCKIPNELKGVTAFRAYEGYQGFKNDHIRLQLIRAVFGQESVKDVDLDEAFQKYLADLAEQKNAANVLPERARNIDRIRYKAILKLIFRLDPNIYETSIFREDPFILELRLVQNRLFSAPISFFFAPFQEGNTWPDEWQEGLNFIEPLYNAYHIDQPRIDAKLVWYDRVDNLSGDIDATELGDFPATFRIQFDGSEFQSSLRSKFEISSLSTLVKDNCFFELIVHKTLSKTAEILDKEKIDIDLQVIADFPEENVVYTLFKSRHSELEKIIFSGEYLSNIHNPIEREVILGLYPHLNSKEENRQKKRQQIHQMLLLLNSAEIEWDDDRRLVARLIDHKIELFALRNRHLFLFNWNEIPNSGNERIKSFLRKDFTNQEYFAYLVFNSFDEIDKAQIDKNPIDDSISITTSDHFLIIKLTDNKTRASVFFRKSDGTECLIQDFLVLIEEGKLNVYISNLLDVLNGCEKLRFLLSPLVFEHQPKYKDGYLLLKAINRIARHFVSISEFSYAAKYAKLSLAVAERMAASNPQEQDYIRWQAGSLRLFAEIKIGMGEIESAKQNLIESIGLFRKLYVTLPNIARFDDFCKSLTHGIKHLTEKGSGDDPIIKELNYEFNKMKEVKSKIKNFVEDTGIDISSIRLDTLEQMSKLIETSKIPGSRNGEEGLCFQAKPRIELDDTTWKEFNQILKKYQYEWTKTLNSTKGEYHWDKYWDKWEKKKE